MISAGFALLQPEAFAAKVARAEPAPPLAGRSEPFASTLRRQSAPAEPSLSAPETQADSAPPDAQEKPDGAQKSPESTQSSDDAPVAGEKPVTNEAKDERTTPDASSDELAPAGEEVEPAPVVGPAKGEARDIPSDSQVSAAPRNAGSDANSSAAKGLHEGEAELQRAVAPTPKEHEQSVALRAQRSGAESPTAYAPGADAEAADAPVEASERAAPSPSPTRKSTNQEARAEASNAPSTADEAVETRAAPRVNPVDSTSSTPDSTSRGDARQFIETLNRAAPQSTASQTTAESSGEHRLFEAQVTRGLEAAMRQNGGSVTMRLKPESLGSMKIDLQIAHGAVAARLEAGTPEARELLQKHLATLRTALEAKGFTVRSIEVQVPSAPNGGETNTEHHRSSSGQSNAHSQDAQSGANGHASGRREDPGGANWNEQSFDPLAEDEGIEPDWRSVYVNGSLNAVA